MRTPLVKPEYGPSLPRLVGPRWRALPPAVRAVAALSGAAALLALAVLALRAGDAGPRVVVREPLAFNFTYGGSLRRVAPGAGELVRLEGRRGGLFLQSFAVEPLRLPPYRGDVGGAYPAYATVYAQRLARRYAGFELAEEGRTRINDVPGYAIAFRARLGRRTLYGRRVLLVPDVPRARDGVVLALLATPAAGVGAAAAVGVGGALKQPLRSFRFGTERP